MGEHREAEPDRDPVRGRRAVHLWVPACLSALLLLAFFPLILRLQPDGFRAATGHSPASYLVRWLLVSAGLFLASGLIYLVGAIRRRRGRERP